MDYIAKSKFKDFYCKPDLMVKSFICFNDEKRYSKKIENVNNIKETRIIT